MIHRSLYLPTRKSALLLGPRQTGKSTLISSLKKADDWMISLLPQREFLAYSREPGRFRDEVIAHHRRYPKATYFVDEVQKIPALRDEAHDLIETLRVRFILTGSSARKLKRGGANLLAGRAILRRLFTLTPGELGKSFELERVLRLGGLPTIWNQDDPLDITESREFLQSYAETYLREEIQQEGIVRQIGPFSRFLEIAAVNDGQVVNYSNIARECGVSVKTAQAHYQILEDTLLAFRIDPFTRSARRRLIQHPKYYFFDPGVTNALTGVRLDSTLSPSIRGRRFEQWCVIQVLTRIHYNDLPLSAGFWRTHTGTEVDLIILKNNNPVLAIEFKSSNALSSRDWSGLKSFREDHPNVPCLIVMANARRRHLADGIEAVGWQGLLEELDLAGNST